MGITNNLLALLPFLFSSQIVILSGRLQHKIKTISKSKPSNPEQKLQHWDYGTKNHNTKIPGLKIMIMGNKKRPDIKVLRAKNHTSDFNNKKKHHQDFKTSMTPEKTRTKFHNIKFLLNFDPYPPWKVNIICEFMSSCPNIVLKNLNIS